MRSEEKVAGPVIDKERVCVVEVEVNALRARLDTRAADMIVIVVVMEDGVNWESVQR